MSDYCKHPKGDILAFKIFRNFMTFMSITFTILSVYLVRKSKSVTRVYANLLILLLLDSMFVDMIVQWMTDPAFLLPLLCVYRRSPLLRVVPMSAAASTGICQSLLAAGCPIYFALFIYRHQTVTPNGSQFKFSNTSRILFVLFLEVVYLSMGATFYMGGIPARNYSYISHLADDWHSSVIDRMECFNTEELYLYYVVSFFDVNFAIIFIILIARHTLHLLSEMKNISVKTQKLHRILTKSLIVQALIPLIIVVAPFGLSLVANMIFSNWFPEVMSDWAVEPLDIMMVVLSFHASTHSLAMILTTPAFRSQFVQLLPITSKSTSAPVRKLSQGTFTTVQSKG